MHTTTSGEFSGSAGGTSYTGRWHLDLARPLTLGAVVHLAGQQQPMALEISQLSGRAMDVGAALPALHSMVARKLRLRGGLARQHFPHRVAPHR